MVVVIYSIATNQVDTLLDILFNDGPHPLTLERPVGDQDLLVVFLDVGQGDSILLKSGDTAVLIDASTPSMGEHIIERLDAYDVDNLDLVIATHPHADHIGGLDEVMKAIPTQQVFMSNLPYDTRQFNQMLDIIEEQDIPVTIPDVGDQYQLSGITLTFLSPDPNEDYDDTNEYSLVCIAQGTFGNVYLGGDTEIHNEEFMLNSRLPDVDIYKASHHGSTTSNSAEFVRALSPEYGIIQCGDDNDYGHPHREIITLFNDMGMDIHRTDLHGEIVALIASDGITITRER